MTGWLQLVHDFADSVGCLLLRSVNRRFLSGIVLQEEVSGDCANHNENRNHDYFTN